MNSRKCLRSHLSSKVLSFVGLVLLLFFPSLGRAELFINEIMYDLSGADDGREWIEIENRGTVAIGILNWKFNEAGSNHKLTLFSGTSTLDPQAYLVIVQDPTKFLADTPGFRGTIVDSSFSLSNEGETLSLIDGALQSVSATSYSAARGAKGDGNSLQNIDGQWVSQKPTPGALNVKVVVQKIELPLEPVQPTVEEKKPPVRAMKNETAAPMLKEPISDTSVTGSSSAHESVNEAENTPPSHPEEGEDQWLWYGALGALIVLGGGAIIFFRKERVGKSGYTIIE